MKQIKLNDRKFKGDLLKDYAKMLLKDGFKVYINNSNYHGRIEDITYFSFVKNDKIGYCQNEYFGGLALSSVHKPCTHAGTGYRLFSEVIKPTLEMAEITLNTIKPNWDNTRKEINKYENWIEYTKQYDSLSKYTEVIL